EWRAALVGGPIASGVGATITGTYGSLVLGADGSWTYTLNNAEPDTNALAQGQAAAGVVTYTMAHSQGAISTHQLTVDIAGTNDQPVANTELITVTEDGAVIAGSVAANDPGDPDTGALVTYTLDAPVTGLTFGANGDFTFDPSLAAYQHLAEGEQQDVGA